METIYLSLSAQVAVGTSFMKSLVFEFPKKRNKPTQKNRLYQTFLIIWWILLIDYIYDSTHDEKANDDFLFDENGYADEWSVLLILKPVIYILCLKDFKMTKLEFSEFSLILMAIYNNY